VVRTPRSDLTARCSRNGGSPFRPCEVAGADAFDLHRRICAGKAVRSRRLGLQYLFIVRLRDDTPRDPDRGRVQGEADQVVSWPSAPRIQKAC